jgi:hypothetical protein
MKEQMWDVINQKAAAQRAVFDRKALHKSVEEVMADAVSAQMQVAQAVVTVEQEPVDEPESPTPEGQTSSAAENGKATLTNSQCSTYSSATAHRPIRVTAAKHKP